jgi:tetratricopeptide (TPR) repeat protein
MNVPKLTAVVSVVCALAAWLPLAAAQERPTRDLASAKSFFNAGAAAYEMGDYAAAIQAFEAAYELTPLPAVAFSLAQAERRQYFVSHERSHLERAIELYRTYLRAVETGGRRADATDALGQLEPLAALSAPSDEAATPSAEAARERTRLLITCAVPSAKVVLDDAAPAGVPLIARVAPGAHRIVLSAEGYFPAERSVEAVPGELVPIEVSLRERPASLSLSVSPESDLHVDGTFLGRAGSDRRFELPRGEHQLTLSQTGHETVRIKAELAPGETRQIAVELNTTTQRKWSIAMFVASGGALLVSGALTGLAIDREEAARKLELERRTGNITPAQLDAYGEAKRDRDRLRGIAATGFALSLASAATGLVLYLLDAPDLRELRAAPDIRVSASGGSPGASVTGQMRF